MLINMRDYLTIHLYTNSSKGTCSAFHSYSSVFNNEHNSYPKMNAKHLIVCSWVLLFTSVDRRYIWTSLSLWCFEDMLHVTWFWLI